MVHSEPCILILEPWDHSEDMDYHPGALEDHSGAVDSHCVAIEAHSGATEDHLDLWRLSLA